MPEFPRAPVAPAELLESYLPAAFAAAPRPDAAAAVTLALGVRLVGEGGGEWVLNLREGDVQVRSGSRAATAFSYVQTVEDWRGALWGARGGAVGRISAALFHPGAPEVEAAVALVGAGIPAAIAALGDLRGLVRAVVSDAAGDWSVALQLGPGELPSQPTTELCVSAADADQMVTGEIEPIEAFMAGRIRILGDMGLLFQMQAALLEATGALAGAARRS
jgi:hypothetical protein